MILELNDTNYDEVTSKEGLVLVKFEAAWCGPCRALTPIYESVNMDYLQDNSVTMTKVDVDSNRDAAVNLGITSIPTIAVYKNGELKEKVGGMMQKAKLLEIMQKYMS